MRWSNETAWAQLLLVASCGDDPDICHVNISGRISVNKLNTLFFELISNNPILAMRLLLASQFISANHLSLSYHVHHNDHC